MSRSQTDVIVYPRTRTTRLLRKRVPLASGSGFTTEPDGVEEVFYETRIDMPALDYLARKAASNKAQRSIDGPLEVRILERRRIS